jgi:uncharacterized protein (DUF433 family)
MSAAIQYPHLSFDSSGEARIEGTRYKVAHLAGEHFHFGWSAEELLRQHPDLRPEEVYAALTYFYDHFAAMVDAMRQTAEEMDAHRRGQALTRDELLSRGGPSGRTG